MKFLERSYRNVEEKLILNPINIFVFSFNDRFSVLAELYVFLQINCM